MTTLHLGTFDSTDVITFMFQYQDGTGLFTAPPVEDPVYRIFQTDGTEITATGIPLTPQAFAGQFVGSIDVDDWDGLGADLAVGKYLIFVYTTDEGLSNSAYYYFDIVAAATRSQDTNATVADLATLFAPAIAQPTYATFIENSVWDADPADHVAVDTFAERTFTADNVADILSALSVTAGFTAGNTLDAITDAVTDCRAVAIGRWKADPVTKKLTLYKIDGSTPLVVFNLLDSDGDPAYVDVAERMPE